MYIDGLKNRLVLVSGANHDYVGVLAEHLPSETDVGVQPAIRLSDAHRLVERASTLPKQSEMAARVLQNETLNLEEVLIPWSTIESITELNIKPEQWSECELW